MKNSSYKSGALFAGMGGFCLGFEIAGFRTCWANDNDPYACQIYRHNFNNTRLIEKDIRDLSVVQDSLEPVDVLHAGFPCQSFSQAGDRRGFDDERSQLFFEIIRIIEEFGQQKPKILVLENAPYLKYGDGGAWFITVMNSIQKAGYWFKESNAQEIDLFDVSDIPQHRIRLFMIAFSRQHFRKGKFPVLPKTCWPKKNTERFVDFWSEQDEYYYMHKQNRYYKMIQRQYSDTDEKRHIYQLRKYLVRQKEINICPTLTANMGAGGHNVPFVWDRKGLRKLTEYECLRLQGFPDRFDFPESVSVAQRYRKIGNSVAPPVSELIARALNLSLTEN